MESDDLPTKQTPVLRTSPHTLLQDCTEHIQQYHLPMCFINKCHWFLSLTQHIDGRLWTPLVISRHLYGTLSIYLYFFKVVRVRDSGLNISLFFRDPRSAHG